MSELRRWSEVGPPPEVRRLLEVGQWERPSRAVFEQALRQVQAAGTLGAVGVQMPSARANALRSAAKWTLIGALIVGGIAALTHTVNREEPGPLTNPAEPVAASPPPVQHPQRPAPVIESPQAPQLAPSAPAKAPPAKSPSIASRAPSERSGSASSEAAAPTSVCKPAVLEQIQMLEQVKSRIRAGRAGEALAMLDRYDAYGKGRCFVPESLKHRMDAQLKLGDQAAARRTANAIKMRYPDTAQARAAEATLTK